MAQVILVPTGITDTAANIASGSEVDIDNGVGTPQDGALVTTKTNAFTTGVVTFALSDLPGDFDSVNSVQFRVRALYDNPGDQSDDATYVFTLTGTGLPATTIAVWNQADTNGLISNKGAGLLETVTATEANINAWTVVLDQTVYNKSMSSDNLFCAISEIEVLVDYNQPVTQATNQVSFRFVDDDGTESAATFTSTLNADLAALGRDTKQRLRIQLSNPENTAEPADAFRIEYRVDAGTWTTLAANNSDVRLVLSDHFADLDPTTERLAGTGTFIAGDMLEGSGIDVAQTGNITLGSGEDTEIEFVFDCTGLISGQFVDFRIVRDDDSLLDNYTQSPRLFVDSSAVQTVLRTTFATPTTPPLTGTDKQKFRLWVRRDSKNDGTGTPTVDLFLYEGGVQRQALATGISVSSDAGQLIEDSWDATNLVTADGSGVELRAVGQVGGTLLNRRTVEFGSVEWCAEYEVVAGSPTASGSPSITPVEAAGTGFHTHMSDGDASITPVEAAGLSERILPADGSPSITPVEAEGLAERVLPADGSPSITPVEAEGLAERIFPADGSPSITPVEAAGTGERIIPSDGSPSITPVEAEGVGVGPAGGPDQTADGSPSITPVEAEGLAERVLPADGSPSITPVEAAGVAEIIQTADGSPSITPVEAAGLAEREFTADGSPSITPIEAAGLAERVLPADGSPSITPVEAAGLAEREFTADGSPSITPVEAAGVGERVLPADGSPSITPIEAEGVGVGPAPGPDQTASGSPSITPVEATGVAEIIKMADGGPSITPITANGLAEVILTAAGSPSISPVTASGGSFIWPKVYLNATETLIGATEMTVVSVDSAGTSITFNDDVGSPTGALFLGVENRSNGDVGWIPVTVIAATGPTIVFGSFGA